jgi:hypothetical protein
MTNIVDYGIGSRLYHAGKGIDKCANADQRAGWRAAKLVNERRW